MPYLIKVSAAPMPSSCRFGRYVRIGLLEVEPGVDDVKMISERARGVVRVVRTWERLHCGTTAASASRRAMAEALRHKAALEAQEEVEIGRLRAELDEIWAAKGWQPSLSMVV